jgi:SAM-dependent methyltransferase
VLGALPPPPVRVLEVGCGEGELAFALGAAGHDVVAVDPRAPAGPIFRQATLEELDEPGPFAAVVAAYSLHHIHDLDGAVERIASLLGPGGALILAEFGWDRFDRATAEWYARNGGGSADAVLGDWREEHEGLHGYAEMRRAVDARFDELSLEWRPYLFRSFARPDLLAAEQEAIARNEIEPVGFRYVGRAR